MIFHLERPNSGRVGHTARRNHENISVIHSAFAAGTLIFIFLPSRNTETGVDKTRLEYLYERKEVVYENLRDLNFEFKAGKFTEADYDGMRLGMEAEAARLLAEIEKLESIPA